MRSWRALPLPPPLLPPVAPNMATESASACPTLSCLPLIMNAGGNESEHAPLFAAVLSAADSAS